MAQGTNAEKLKKLQRRMLLIFVVIIPALLAIVYFAFLRTAPQIIPPKDAPAETQAVGPTPAPAKSPVPSP